jgi:hypothetical protein
MFNYPVGVQLFNRPEYARRLLTSLKEQNLEIHEKWLFIYIDGFPGSIYESRKSADHVSRVETIAREIFPLANIRLFSHNRGIAELHNLMQVEVFSVTNEWAVFFEEDIVLDPAHLQELSQLIEICDSREEVAKVSCFQILEELAHLPRGYQGFYPGTGTKAFAERKSFFIEKQTIMSRYIEIVKDELKSQSQFVNSRKGALMGAEGYLLSYFQKDSLIESFLHFNRKLHVTTKPNLATDIGIDGVHNFVTPAVKVDEKQEVYSASLEQRKREFELSLSEIKKESIDHIVGNYQTILEGFYTSRSRIAMLRKIFWTTLGKFK